MRKKKETQQIPLLEFRNIAVSAGRKRILDSLSVKIYPGEHVAILGPNGAGKSTFIKAITREYYPDPRKNYLFRVWGQDVWNVFDLRNTLGIVTDDLQYSFREEISGLDTVMSGFFGSIGLYRDDVTAKMRKKVDEVISFLEIGGLKHRSLLRMSSGEARRFLIGRALVHDPRALILDEPFNSLDLRAARNFRKLLVKIARAGIGIILVTHNLSDIIPEVSRVILMKKGRIYADGPTEKILTDRNMGGLFDVRVAVRKINGRYYAFAA